VLFITIFGTLSFPVSRQSQQRSTPEKKKKNDNKKNAAARGAITEPISLHTATKKCKYWHEGSGTSAGFWLGGQCPLAA